MAEEEKCPRCGGQLIFVHDELKCLQCSRVVRHQDWRNSVQYGAVWLNHLDGEGDPEKSGRSSSMRSDVDPHIREPHVPLYDGQMKLVGRVPYRPGKVCKWNGYYYFCNEAVEPWARVFDPYVIGAARRARLRGLDTSCLDKIRSRATRRAVKRESKSVKRVVQQRVDRESKRVVEQSKPIQRAVKTRVVPWESLASLTEIGAAIERQRTAA
jgi:hypothetical protein